MKSNSPITEILKSYLAFSTYLETNQIHFIFSYAMDGLSADKLRIFLHPVETDSIPKKKTHENESAGTDETGVTTLTSIMDKRDQVKTILICMKNQ
jgi:hypothetical protein